MEFEFTEEQRILRENVRKFLSREIEPIVDEYDRKYHPLPKEIAHKLLKKFVPLGFLSCLVPEEYGGLGQSRLTFGVMMEELRKVYASLGGVVGIAATTTQLIAEYGNDEQKQNYLEPMMRGDLIGCLAITEPDAGSDASNIRTTAVLSGDKYIINGTKMWISNGTIADVCIVVATTDRSKGREAICRFIVDRRQSQFKARDIPKIGLKSFPTAELVFEDCEVPKENLFGRAGGGYEAVMKDLEFARVNAALAAVGIAQAALDYSIKYVKERKQFGRPIGSFQLVQSLIAEMMMGVEAARLMSYKALSIIDRGKRCRLESSMAKAYATEMAVKVTSKAIQIHGAYGLSEEFPLERYYRDARCYTIPDGTTEIHKLIIGREATGMKAFV